MARRCNGPANVNILVSSWNAERFLGVQQLKEWRSSIDAWTLSCALRADLLMLLCCGFWRLIVCPFSHMPLRSFMSSTEMNAANSELLTTQYFAKSSNIGDLSQSPLYNISWTDQLGKNWLKKDDLHLFDDSTHVIRCHWPKLCSNKSFTVITLFLFYFLLSYLWFPHFDCLEFVLYYTTRCVNTNSYYSYIRPTDRPTAHN